MVINKFVVQYVAEIFDLIMSSDINAAHKDIMSMNEDEVREELQARHAINLEREERRQKIEEIVYKEGTSHRLMTMRIWRKICLRIINYTLRELNLEKRFL